MAIVERSRSRPYWTAKRRIVGLGNLQCVLGRVLDTWIGASGFRRFGADHCTDPETGTGFRGVTGFKVRCLWDWNSVADDGLERNTPGGFCCWDCVQSVDVGLGQCQTRFRIAQSRQEKRSVDALKARIRSLGVRLKDRSK